MSRLVMFFASLALLSPAPSWAACRIFDWDGSLLPSAVCDGTPAPAPAVRDDPDPCKPGHGGLSNPKCAAKISKAVAEERVACLQRQRPQIGMTVAEVLASRWGRPAKVNRTESRALIHEQWVYEGTLDTEDC